MQMTPRFRSKKRIGDYAIEGELGRGEFGVVYLAISAITNDKFAVKCIAKEQMNANEMYKKLFNTEIAIMNKINHRNIVHLHELMESDNNYYLVIDYCDKGDFGQFMRARQLRYMEESEAVGYLSQIMNGFRELRRNRIIHRDFKLANILVNGNEAKIADFGFAKRGRDVARTIVGTYMTMAPELLVSSGESEYTSKSDLWSLGVVYYQILFGEPPYFGLTPNEIYQDIKRKSAALCLPRRVSAASHDLIARLLRVDPDERIEWSDFFAHRLFAEPPRRSLSVGDAREAKRALTAEPSARAESEAVRGAAQRYYHEKNKALFIVFTVRHLRKLTKMEIYDFVAEPLFALCIRLLRKAIEICDSTLESLVSKQNAFDLSAFSDFSHSEQYISVIRAFESDRPNFQSYLRYLLKTARQLGFDGAAERCDERRALRRLRDALDRFERVARRELLIGLCAALLGVECDARLRFDAARALSDWGEFHALSERKSDCELFEHLKAI